MVTKRNATTSKTMLLWASVFALAIYFVPYPYNVFALYPLRLFITLIHESGHALAAVLTGGSVNYLQVFTNGEGVTWSQTSLWAQGIVISGGYLGTTIFGAILLQLARSPKWKTTLAGIALYVLAVTLIWAHNPFDNLFTLVVGIVLGAILLGLARGLPPIGASFVVTFLAVQCCLNAVGDLRILLQLTTTMPGKDNDAVFMSQHFPFPPTFWAIAWAVAAVCILALSLKSYLGRSPARKQA